MINCLIRRLVPILLGLIVLRSATASHELPLPKAPENLPEHQPEDNNNSNFRSQEGAQDFELTAKEEPEDVYSGVFHFPLPESNQKTSLTEDELMTSGVYFYFPLEDYLHNSTNTFIAKEGRDGPTFPTRKPSTRSEPNHNVADFQSSKASDGHSNGAQERDADVGNLPENNNGTLIDTDIEQSNTATISKRSAIPTSLPREESTIDNTNSNLQEVESTFDSANSNIEGVSMPSYTTQSLSPEIHFSANYYADKISQPSTTPQSLSPVVATGEGVSMPSYTTQNLSPEIHFSANYYADEISQPSTTPQSLSPVVATGEGVSMPSYTTQNLSPEIQFSGKSIGIPSLEAQNLSPEVHFSSEYYLNLFQSPTAKVESTTDTINPLLPEVHLSSNHILNPTATETQKVQSLAPSADESSSPTPVLQQGLSPEIRFSSTFWMSNAPSEKVSQPSQAPILYPSPISSSIPSTAASYKPSKVDGLAHGLPPEISFSSYWMTYAPTLTPSLAPSQDNHNEAVPGSTADKVSPKVEGRNPAPSKLPSSAPTTSVDDDSVVILKEVHFESNSLAHPMPSSDTTNESLLQPSSFVSTGLSPEIHFAANYWVHHAPKEEPSEPTVSDTESLKASSSRPSKAKLLSPTVQPFKFSNPSISPSTSSTADTEPTGELYFFAFDIEAPKEKEEVKPTHGGSLAPPSLSPIFHTPQQIDHSVSTPTMHSETIDSKLNYFTVDIASPEKEEGKEKSTTSIPVADPSMHVFEFPTMPSKESSSSMPTITVTEEVTAEFTPELVAEGLPEEIPDSFSATEGRPQQYPQSASELPSSRPQAIAPSIQTEPTLSPAWVATDIPTKEPSDLSTSGPSLRQSDQVASSLPTSDKTVAPSMMPSMPTLMYLEEMLLPQKRKMNDKDNSTPVTAATDP